MSDRLQEVAEVEQALVGHGQAALLAQIAGWEPAVRTEVLRQLAAVDLEELFGAFPRGGGAAAPVRAVLEPAPVRTLDPEERRSCASQGATALAEGAVAALVVAGGMGTRLGFEGPKGALPIGPVSGQSLFGHHAAQIRGAANRAGVKIPWLIMTSRATDAPTRALFEQNDHFGLDPADLFFLCQQDLPCLDLEGNLIVEAPGRLAWSPDGHGGLFGALAAQGPVLEELARRGVRVLSYFQVDNPLLPVIDPVAIGCHVESGVEWTVKVIEKQSPDEKLGNCVRGGRASALRIIEYTELEEPERSQRLADGRLRIGAGAIGAHLLSLDFVRRVAADPSRLPLHLSAKRIRTLADGAPGAVDGYKLERFVFDALPRARRALALQVDRAEEYAPVKNATGAYSPATARRALSERNRAWLERAGVRIPGARRGGATEIDFARWPDPGSLGGATACTVRSARDGILVSDGDAS